MVLVFDLDDTLYEELAYVRSGLRAVADYLVPIIGVSKRNIIAAMEIELQMNRQGIFDRLLLKNGKYTKKLVQNCVRVYRSHEPSLTLFPEARACLALFHDYPIYIVTDGNKLVQRKKVLALGLDGLIRRCFYTTAHGIERCKPSPYCFEKICQLEKIPPREVVYIADNPHKDFIGIKPLGFQTIRVLTGTYRHDKVEEAYEAHQTIHSLRTLNEKLIKKMI